MSKNVVYCMITPMERTRRKLIYLPSTRAQDYFSFCEELGCDWEPQLNQIHEKIDNAALLELPDYLVKPGFTKTAAGIEVPLEYQGAVPDGYLVAELPACVMLYVQSEPFENENDFCTAIEHTYAAIQTYNAELYGYQLAYDKAPSFNFGAQPETGARIAIPAVRSNQP